MKVNNINSFKPNFGHISKQAVDGIRYHAEGYRVNNKNKDFYSADTRYQLMDEQNLKRFENLVTKASLLDNSWIHYEPNKGLIVDFYKNCNPKQIVRFEEKEEGNVDSALDKLENALYIAETGEYASIDKNKASSPLWETPVENVNHTMERFKSEGENKLLNRIYTKSFDIKG